MSKQAKVLTAGDIKLALAVAGSERNKCILMISILAGLRAIEIAKLTIGSVADSNDKILDRIVLTKHQTKGRKARSVPISRSLAKHLQAHLRTLTPRAMESHRPLFISQKTGEGFTAHGVVMFFQRLYKAAGITGASSHSGRHTFASKLSENGISVFVIRALMGHKNINTTARYVFAGEHMQKNAVELL